MRYVTMDTRHVVTVLLLDREETETTENKTYEIRGVALIEAYNNIGTPHTSHVVVLQQKAIRMNKDESNERKQLIL